MRAAWYEFRCREENSDEHQIDVGCIRMPGLRPLALSAQRLSESVSAHGRERGGARHPHLGELLGGADENNLHDV